MARDYAKKTTAKKKPSRKKSKQNQSSSHRWLIIAAIAGIFFVGAGYYFLHTGYHAHQVAAKNKPANNEIAPKFDFYTLLSNDPKSDAAKKTSSNAVKEQYYLQIAAVKNFIDADRLRAQLTLLGFNVKISAFKAGKNVLNQISVGPYSSSKLAKIDQDRLKEKHINSLLIKKPNK